MRRTFRIKSSVKAIAEDSSELLTIVGEAMVSIKTDTSPFRNKEWLAYVDVTGIAYPKEFIDVNYQVIAE